MARRNEESIAPRFFSFAVFFSGRATRESLVIRHQSPASPCVLFFLRFPRYHHASPPPPSIARSLSLADRGLFSFSLERSNYVRVARVWRSFKNIQRVLDLGQPEHPRTARWLSSQTCAFSCIFFDRRGCQKIHRSAPRRAKNSSAGHMTGKRSRPCYATSPARNKFEITSGCCQNRSASDGEKGGTK